MYAGLAGIPAVQENVSAFAATPMNAGAPGTAAKVCVETAFEGAESPQSVKAVTKRV